MAQAKLDAGPYERTQDEYPLEWREDFERLTTLVFDLAHQYGMQISIRVTDPRSLRGIFLALRYGVRRYPTFIIDRREKICGWEVSRLRDVLDRLCASVGAGRSDAARGGKDRQPIPASVTYAQKDSGEAQNLT